MKGYILRDDYYYNTMFTWYYPNIKSVYRYLNKTYFNNAVTKSNNIAVTNRIQLMQRLNKF